MTALIPIPTIERSAGQEQRIDEAELAAAAFLARYQGRTLDAYRYDLRAFFQWAVDEGLVILSATRPQIELYVRAMEDRGLAATTIDRRLSSPGARSTRSACSQRAGPTSSASPATLRPGDGREQPSRRLCTVAGFYRYAEQEGLRERSPAAHVRRPRLDYESHATGLDRNEVGPLLVAAGLPSAGARPRVGAGHQRPAGLGAWVEHWNDHSKPFT